NYKNTLQAQVLESAGRQRGAVTFGADLPEETLGQFQEEQIGQLYELMLESTKPNKQFDIHEDSRAQCSLQNCKNSLQTQVLESAGRQRGAATFGADLPEETLGQFQDEQISQLYDLAHLFMLRKMNGR
ncbi:hypothetical protein CCH79_00016816, partial [Gambusia affinis]